jgi:hypothetical protein
MTDSIIERAAKILADVSDHEWAAAPEPKREFYRKTVRAVLQAIRDPSEAMVQAGHDLDSGIFDNEAPPEQRWQAMIDAALAEGKDA